MKATTAGLLAATAVALRVGWLAAARRNAKRYVNELAREFGMGGRSRGRACCARHGRPATRGFRRWTCGSTN